ncbi:MAG: thiamine phosphate synthase [Solirubrobacteraceae bacterium]
MSDRRDRLNRAVLYLVCDERSDAFLKRALRGGVDIVQLRIKDGCDDDRIVAVGRRYARACEAKGALLIVNDRPDLALAAGADGVHLGQDDVAVTEARALLGEQRIVGLSTHTRAQIDVARGLAVDYIGVGPVHATPTKPGRPAVGLELVSYAARHSALPFFAIGGIDAANVAAVRDAGASRVAVVRALTDASDPEAGARALRAGLAGTASDSEVGVGAAG